MGDAITQPIVRVINSIVKPNWESMLDAAWPRSVALQTDLLLERPPGSHVTLSAKVNLRRRRVAAGVQFASTPPTYITHNNTASQQTHQ